MLLLVGLGNPGPKYENNRHNIGFMAVDQFVRRHTSFSPWKSRFQGLVSEGRVGTENLLLLKPHTHMNNSGQAVGEAMRFYKLDSRNVFVIYDELDIQPGRLKVKFAGGNSGHNGLRSIDAHIGKDYTRIRLGIGHPGDKNKVSSHVLGDFGKQEHKRITRQIDAVIEALPELLEAEDIDKGSGKFMTRVGMLMNLADNQKKNREKQAGEAAPKSKPESKLESKSILSGLEATLQKARDRLNNS